jgi:PAS domain S-box-containing protein
MWYRHHTHNYGTPAGDTAYDSFEGTYSYSRLESASPQRTPSALGLARLKKTAVPQGITTRSGIFFYARFVHGVNHFLCGIGDMMKSKDQRDLSEPSRAKGSAATTTSETWPRYLSASIRIVFFICEPVGDYRITFITDNVETLLGYRSEEITNSPGFWLSHTHPEDQAAVNGALENLVQGACGGIEYRFLHRDGTYRWVRDEITLVCEPDGKPLEIIGNRLDITNREASEALKRTYDELVHQVEELTQELQRKTRHLEDADRALDFLVKQRESSQGDLEETILSNATLMLEPCIRKLKNSGLNDMQKAYLSILESQLAELTSPFTRTLSSKHLGLTPMELRVADFVRNNISTREIADLLHISKNTVIFHRYNLRAKLGMKGTKMNLASYLQSLL